MKNYVYEWGITPIGSYIETIVTTHGVGGGSSGGRVPAAQARAGVRARGAQEHGCASACARPPPLWNNTVNKSSG